MRAWFEGKEEGGIRPGMLLQSAVSAGTHLPKTRTYAEINTGMWVCMSYPYGEVLALSFERVWREGHPNKTRYAWHPDLGSSILSPSKKNQGSLGRVDSRSRARKIQGEPSLAPENFL